jgi:hypothetical protein
MKAIEILDYLSNSSLFRSHQSEADKYFKNIYPADVSKDNIEIRAHRRECLKHNLGNKLE